MPKPWDATLITLTLWNVVELSLPETASLPSVLAFAECFLSGARQRGYLPSAIEKALGKQMALDKEVVCRVPSTRQTITLGKDQVYRVSDTWQTRTLGKGPPPLTLCRVSRQSPDLPSVILWHSVNHIFFIFDLQTFSAVLIQYLVLHVPMWHISRTTSIFL